MEGSVYKNNPSNNSMHYNDSYTVGILNPPDKLAKKVWYSYNEGQKEYGQMQNDLYVGYKNAKPISKSKIPIIIQVATGLALVLLGICNYKKIGSFFSKLFKKTPIQANPIDPTV